MIRLIARYQNGGEGSRGKKEPKKASNKGYRYLKFKNYVARRFDLLPFKNMIRFMINVGHCFYSCSGS